jgi:hemolysin III
MPDLVSFSPRTKTAPISGLLSAPSPLPRAEEMANCATHALGFVLSLVGTVALLRLTAEHGDALQMVGVAIYGATLMALYSASTLSHSFERPRLRHFFRTVDQVCIFLLIAGTYTPIAFTYLRHGWWWALFVAIWGMALTGIFVKIFYTRLHGVSVSAYVLLGWMPVIAIRPIVAAMPTAALMWIVIGGIFYTLGTLFLMLDEKVPFFHAIWHLFVIAGSACHYYAVLQFVLPPG